MLCVGEGWVGPGLSWVGPGLGWIGPELGWDGMGWVGVARPFLTRPCFTRGHTVDILAVVVVVAPRLVTWVVNHHVLECDVQH